MKPDHVEEAVLLCLQSLPQSVVTDQKAVTKQNTADWCLTAMKFEADGNLDDSQQLSEASSCL